MTPEGSFNTTFMFWFSELDDEQDRTGKEKINKQIKNQQKKMNTDILEQFAAYF